MRSWLTKNVNLTFMSLCVIAVLLAPLDVYAGPRAMFERLEDDMEEATADFFDAIHEVLDRDGSLKKGAKPPRDDRTMILRKMDVLAKKYADTPDGGYMAANTMLWSVDLEPKLILPRFTYLAEHFTNDPALDLVLEQFEFFYEREATPQAWAKALRNLAKRTARGQTKFSATFYASLALVPTKQANQTRPWLREVLKTATSRKTSDDAAQKIDADLTAQLSQQAKGLLFEVERLQVGMTAPGFATKTLDGKPLSLSSLRGKVVLLDFWATWCPNCIAEFPNLAKVQKQLSGKPFVIISISLDDSRDMAQRLVQSMKAPGIHTWDLQDGENPVGKMYNVRQLPTWYLLDQQGVIRHRDPQSQELVALVESILKK